MGVTINSVSTRRQAGAEYLLFDSCAQHHACPTQVSSDKKTPLPDPGIHALPVELDSNMTEDDW